MFAQLLVVVLALALTAQAAAPASDHFKDLGPQITSTLVQGSTFTKSPDGRDLLCTVIRGQPAKLLVYDVVDGKLLHRFALEGAHGAWNACTATDKSVYVGTDDNGHLYRWVPGDETVHDLGQVAPDQTFAWQATPGKDGEVFVGTYPGCLVIRYHPADGFRDVGRGAVAEHENYARSVAYDAVNNKIYIGVGSHAHLIELDPKTGEKKDILPPKYKSYKFCYTVNFVGGKLFALPTDPPEGLVIDPKTYEIVANIPDAKIQQKLSPLSPDGKVYFYTDGKLGTFDTKTNAVKVLPADGGSLAFGWMNDAKLASFAGGGTIFTYDPATGATTSKKVQLPPEPTPIHQICLGPDGKIYCGGYLSGGLGVYDPASGNHVEYTGLSQTEGIGVFGNRLYFGVYPHARLLYYDVTKPWNTRQNNPKQFDELNRVEQDRPFGVIGVEALNKVFVGTVPDYGKLGGVFAIVDPKTDAVETHRNIVQDQGIVSLVWADGVVVGGTTISGGLGIEPTTKEAKIFIWDPKENKVTFEAVPVQGKGLVTGLVVGPDKQVWGIADGVLFTFDVRERKVTFTKKLFDVDPKSRHANWRDAVMLLHPSGQIYGTVSNKLFRLDPSTKEATVLRENESALLAMDREGRLYFRNGMTKLMQYTP